MLQKVIKVGNSSAVTLPKQILEEFKIKAGDQVYVELDHSTSAVIISAKENPYKGVSPDIASWTKKFIEKNRKALEDLANL